MKTLNSIMDCIIKEVQNNGYSNEYNNCTTNNSYNPIANTTMDKH